MFVVFFFFSLLDFDAGTRTSLPSNLPRRAWRVSGTTQEAHRSDACPYFRRFAPCTVTRHGLPASCFVFLIFEFCLARFFFVFFLNFTRNILLHKKLAVFPTGSLQLVNCTINCSLFNVDLMGAWGKGGMVETGLFLDKQERDLLVEGTFFPRRPGWGQRR